MPFKMKDQTFYRTKEVCQIAGISRSTLLRWYARGVIQDTTHRDIRGWRLFTQADVQRIEDLATTID